MKILLRQIGGFEVECLLKTFTSPDKNVYLSKGALDLRFERSGLPHGSAQVFGYNPALKTSILLHKTFCGVKFARRRQPVAAYTAQRRRG